MCRAFRIIIASFNIKIVEHYESIIRKRMYALKYKFCKKNSILNGYKMLIDDLFLSFNMLYMTPCWQVSRINDCFFIKKNSHLV
jgi:hypothetical protein